MLPCCSGCTFSASGCRHLMFLVGIDVGGSALTWSKWATRIIQVYGRWNFDSTIRSRKRNKITSGLAAAILWLPWIWSYNADNFSGCVTSKSLRISIFVIFETRDYTFHTASPCAVGTGQLNDPIIKYHAEVDFDLIHTLAFSPKILINVAESCVQVGLSSVFLP
jgi:hypothetical protein